MLMPNSKYKTTYAYTIRQQRPPLPMPIMLQCDLTWWYSGVALASLSNVCDFGWRAPCGAKMEVKSVVFEAINSCNRLTMYAYIFYTVLQYILGFTDVS